MWAAAFLPSRSRSREEAAADAANGNNGNGERETAGNAAAAAAAAAADQGPTSIRQEEEPVASGPQAEPPRRAEARGDATTSSDLGRAFFRLGDDGTGGSHGWHTPARSDAAAFVSYASRAMSVRGELATREGQDPECEEAEHRAVDAGGEGPGPSAGRPSPSLAYQDTGLSAANGSSPARPVLANQPTIVIRDIQPTAAPPPPLPQDKRQRDGGVTEGKKDKPSAAPPPSSKGAPVGVREEAGVQAGAPLANAASQTSYTSSFLRTFSSTALPVQDMTRSTAAMSDQCVQSAPQLTDISCGGEVPLPLASQERGVGAYVAMVDAAAFTQVGASTVAVNTATKDCSEADCNTDITVTELHHDLMLRTYHPEMKDTAVGDRAILHTVDAGVSPVLPLSMPMGTMTDGPSLKHATTETLEVAKASVFVSTDVEVRSYGTSTDKPSLSDASDGTNVPICEAGINTLPQQLASMSTMTDSKDITSTAIMADLLPVPPTTMEQGVSATKQMADMGTQDSRYTSSIAVSTEATSRGEKSVGTERLVQQTVDTMTTGLVSLAEKTTDTYTGLFQSTIGTNTAKASLHSSTTQASPSVRAKSTDTAHLLKTKDTATDPIAAPRFKTTSTDTTALPWGEEKSVQAVPPPPPPTHEAGVMAVSTVQEGGVQASTAMRDGTTMAAPEMTSIATEMRPVTKSIAVEMAPPPPAPAPLLVHQGVQSLVDTKETAVVTEKEQKPHMCQKSVEARPDRHCVATQANPHGKASGVQVQPHVMEGGVNTDKAAVRATGVATVNAQTREGGVDTRGLVATATKQVAAVPSTEPFSQQTGASVFSLRHSTTDPLPPPPAFHKDTQASPVIADAAVGDQAAPLCAMETQTEVACKEQGINTVKRGPSMPTVEVHLRSPPRSIPNGSSRVTDLDVQIYRPSRQPRPCPSPPFSCLSSPRIPALPLPSPAAAAAAAAEAGDSAAGYHDNAPEVSRPKEEAWEMPRIPKYIPRQPDIHAYPAFMTDSSEDGPSAPSAPPPLRDPLIIQDRDRDREADTEGQEDDHEYEEDDFTERRREMAAVADEEQWGDGLTEPRREGVSGGWELLEAGKLVQAESFAGEWTGEHFEVYMRRIRETSDGAHGIVRQMQERLGRRARRPEQLLNTGRRSPLPAIAGPPAPEQTSMPIAEALREQFEQDEIENACFRVVLQAFPTLDPIIVQRAVRAAEGDMTMALRLVQDQYQRNSPPQVNREETSISPASRSVNHGSFNHGSLNQEGSDYSPRGSIGNGTVYRRENGSLGVKIRVVTRGGKDSPRQNGNGGPVGRGFGSPPDQQPRLHEEDQQSRRGWSARDRPEGSSVAPSRSTLLVRMVTAGPAASASNNNNYNNNNNNLPPPSPPPRAMTPLPAPAAHYASTPRFAHPVAGAVGGAVSPPVSLPPTFQAPYPPPTPPPAPLAATVYHPPPQAFQTTSYVRYYAAPSSRPPRVVRYAYQSDAPMWPTDPWHTPASNNANVHREVRPVLTPRTRAGGETMPRYWGMQPAGTAGESSSVPRQMERNGAHTNRNWIVEGVREFWQMCTTAGCDDNDNTEQHRIYTG
ncbi:unnamed protein product [Vitrella brassicaformis CCMP3155]|uniref:CUE domain-containing protein n=4 Tax=Vitrella brassicaformis TaxID=1169539 RepID=A0A0G4FBY3_VITBC|nr:unnamed protein product [Vitrella brassicaformis CCMP3155]|eukprot:CEM10111.1 unnamed protein product [Vitrella brassicaformis CCMP3155]